MSALKKWFENRKLDVKFKKAGDGHKVDDKSKQRRESSTKTSYQKPVEQSTANRQAAEAALARINHTKPVLSSISSNKRKEIKQDAKDKSLNERVDVKPVQISDVGQTVNEVVLFECPMIGEMILPKSDMLKQIEDFLNVQYVEDPLMASCFMIHTYNKNKDKIDACIDILMKYLTNIVNNHGEEKYCKIKTSNAIYLEKVAPLKGAEEFMISVGFKKEKITKAENTEEEYFIMDREFATDFDRLNLFKDVLENAEPIKPKLYRDMKVFFPSTRAHEISVPNEFYHITPEELKRQQQEKSEQFERLGMLRTKEMRELDQLRELRIYKYTKIRVKFPDGILLQGSFYASDKLEVLYSFVRDNLTNDWLPFSLKSHGKIDLNDNDKLLVELQLAPAAIVYFMCDPEIERDLQNASLNESHHTYLKSEIMNDTLTL